MSNDSTHYLSFMLWHEDAAPTPSPSKPTLAVRSASADGTHIAWEFTIEELERRGGGTELQVSVFDDGLLAFAAIPTFFAELATRRPRRLVDVIPILIGMDAIDDTQRRRPAATALWRSCRSRLVHSPRTRHQ